MRTRLTSEDTQEIHTVKNETFKETKRCLDEAITRIQMRGATPANFDVSNKTWKEIPSQNVEIISCSLDDETDKLTIVNVIFHKGGHVLKHTHDKLQVIFVVEGTLYDPVNDVMLDQFQSISIPPGKPHAYQSDYCLAQVIWQPAYPKKRRHAKANCIPPCVNLPA